MPPPALKAQPDLATHLGFLLAEEEALKAWLTGITVPTRPGEPGTTRVECYFRYPEGERQISYPFITIDLISIEPNFDLMTSTYYQDTKDLYQPSVSPTLPPGPFPGTVPAVREYLPFNILWQVSTYARSALHDRFLTSIFTTDIIPVRPFFIHTQADDVMRRTERVSFQTADTMETTESGTKRIFRKIYTVQMLAEIPNQVFADAWAYETVRVLIPVVARDRFDHYLSTILDTDDPIDDHTDEERLSAGEYFYIAHEGSTVPPAT